MVVVVVVVVAAAVVVVILMRDWHTPGEESLFQAANVQTTSCESPIRAMLSLGVDGSFRFIHCHSGV